MHPRQIMHSHGEIVLVLPNHGYSGAALLALVSRLQLHAIPYVVAAPRPGTCSGTGGAHITASLTVAQVVPEETGGVVILDGTEGTLGDYDEVLNLIRQTEESGVFLCAVAEGVMALARAGVLRGCAVAADRHTADRMRQAGLGPVLEPIYTCDRVITATEAGASALGDAIHGLRGPAAATPELPA